MSSFCQFNFSPGRREDLLPRPEIFKLGYCLTEHFTPVLVVLKLVKAGAGRREQDHIANNRVLRGFRDSF